MDEFLRDINTLVFREWILNQTYENCNIRVHEKHSNIIVIESKYSYSEIIFNIKNIIEFHVINRFTKETKFYLHFQIKTLKHAVQLYNEMLGCIENLILHPQIKILLTCSSGLTTSFFASKLNEASRILNLNYSIDAVGYNNLYKVAQDYDMILLAPQISYQYSKTKAAFKNKIVLNFPPNAFAQYDIQKSFLFIKNALLQRSNVDDVSTQLSVPSQVSFESNILVLSIFKEDNKIQILYRLYNHYHEILINNTIIKLKFHMQDILDIVDTCLSKYERIEKIAICTPGINIHNHLNDTEIDDLDQSQFIELVNSRYNQEVYFFNDINAATLGYYRSQENYQNIVLMYQPRDGFAKAGIIMNGQLVAGRNQVAGKLKYIPYLLSREPQFEDFNPDFMTELLCKTIVSVIAVLNPDVIVISCDYISQTKELIKAIETFVPSQYIPQIKLLDHFQEYSILGGAILANQKKSL